MQVKKMVRKGGRWVESYVDMGPSRARRGHGLPTRRINNQTVGPVRLAPKSA